MPKTIMPFRFNCMSMVLNTTFKIKLEEGGCAEVTVTLDDPDDRGLSLPGVIGYRENPDQKNGEKELTQDTYGASPSV